MPAAPSAGGQIAFIDYAGTFATNPIAIDFNGKRYNSLQAQIIKIGITRASFVLVFLDDTQGWTMLDYSPEPRSASYLVEYVCVGGGGGGTRSGTPNLNMGGGGGGGGGFLTGTLRLAVGSVYTITVGAGGIGSYNPTSGAASSLIGPGVNVSRLGGAHAATNVIAPTGFATGGGGNWSVIRNSLGTEGQGFAGGMGSFTGSRRSGGGGGGSAGTGSFGSPLGGGFGGKGTISFITGVAVMYGAGGGGSAMNSIAGWPNGGSATSGFAYGAVVNGLAGQGYGGGGADSGLSGTGGSGIVILSIPTVFDTQVRTGTVTTQILGDNRVVRWLTSGTYTA
jgi:hypothetical protein